MLVSFYSDNRGKFCIKKVAKKIALLCTPRSHCMQVVKHLRNLRLFGNVLLIQERHRARWHLRVCPLAQAQHCVHTKTTALPARGLGAASAWIPCYSGWHCSHTAESFCATATWLHVFCLLLLLILQQWSPYYLNCFILYMPTQISTLNPTTICFSQHIIVMSFPVK